jgi:riboflavin kinase/FMN adenylyltransferase
MMNVGVRPTVDGMHHLAEVNIFDFNDDIYGKKIKVTLHRRLRAELKFPSLDALRQQLEKDRDDAISLLRDPARQAF